MRSNGTLELISPAYGTANTVRIAELLVTLPELLLTTTANEEWSSVSARRRCGIAGRGCAGDGHTVLHPLIVEGIAAGGRHGRKSPRFLRPRSDLAVER